MDKEKRLRKWMKKAFQKYLSEDTIEKTLNGELQDEIKNRPIEKQATQYLMIRINEEISNIVHTVNAVVGTLYADHWKVDIISTVLIAYKQYKRMEDIPNQDPMIDALMKEYKDSISILKGKKECIMTLLGSETCMQYSLIIPNASELRQKLMTSELGKVISE